MIALSQTPVSCLLKIVSERSPRLLSWTSLGFVVVRMMEKRMRLVRKERMTEILVERFLRLLEVVWLWLVAVFTFTLAVIETIRLISIRKERKLLEEKLNERQGG